MMLRKVAALVAYAVGAGALAFSGWALYEALAAEEPAIGFLVFAAPVVIVIIGVFTLLAWAFGWFLWNVPPAERRPPTTAPPVHQLPTRPHAGPHEPAGSGAAA